MSDEHQPAVTMADFFSGHFPALVRFAYRRLGDRHLAEEIAVDCLVLAWQRGAPTELGRAWLYRTAENRIGDALRRRKRERRLLEELQGEHHSSAAADESSVAEAMDRLAEADRAILRYQYWDELPAAEIAQLLDISVAAVWKRSSRAHQRLRDLLESHPADPTSARGQVITNSWSLTNEQYSQVLELISHTDAVVDGVPTARDGQPVVGARRLWTPGPQA